MGSIAVFNDMAVPCIIQKYFTDLCRLAYNGIVKRNYNVQLIFGESDLPEDFDNLGFMDSVTELYVTRGTVSSPTSDISGVPCCSPHLKHVLRRTFEALSET